MEAVHRLIQRLAIFELQLYVFFCVIPINDYGWMDGITLKGESFWLTLSFFLVMIVLCHKPNIHRGQELIYPNLV